MANKIKEINLIAILLFVFGYLLNFFWESFHAVFLYEGHNFVVKKFVLMIGYVSIIDALIILGLYLTTSLIFRDILWIKNINKKSLYTFAAFGLIVAAIIEYKAIYLFNQWEYSKLMPTIFGLGLSPLIQLSITGLLSLFITKRLIFKNAK